MRLFANSAFHKWLLIAVGALTLFPVSALASEASGKFTLTREVHWAGVVLPAGEYTYSLEHRGSPLLLVRGASGTPGYLMMARTIDSVATESDSLVLQRHGDEWFVSEMVVGSVGEEFSFAAPEANPISARKKGSGTDKVASLSQP
ncbi:MAG TPA: hypothetical protein VNY29_07070 [Terriglobales bacterium]|nr:hypothetical protein [Terriglobales bacterium]